MENLINRILGAIRFPQPKNPPGFLESNATPYPLPVGQPTTWPSQTSEPNKVRGDS